MFMAAMLKYSKLLRINNLSGKWIAICEDSHVVLKAPTKVEFSSKLYIWSAITYNYFIKLQAFNEVDLDWIPRPSNILVDEIQNADELAKAGDRLKLRLSKNVNGTSQRLYNIANETLRKKSDRCWSDANAGVGCRVSSKLWPIFNSKDEISCINNKKLLHFVSILMGRCLLRKHAHK